MTIRPTALPKLRRQTLRYLNDPTSAIRKNTSAELAPGFDALAINLEAADLFWVQEDMTALAMHAGEKLAAARWATADRPTPCGMLYWQGGIGHMDAHGVQIPIEACAWGPHEGEMMLWFLMSRDRLVATTEAVKKFVLLTDEIPPLVPVYGSTIPITDEPLSMLALDSELPVPIVSALASAWLLMQQPLLIDRTRERADKATARAYARDGMPAPDVTVVDLRRQYTPQDQGPDTGTDGRRYRHRWVVSGHWRNQAYGPSRTLRRQTWVPSHVKGPEGAPLLSTEKVNVWRR